jgi:hypothetical protein
MNKWHFLKSLIRGEFLFGDFDRVSSKKESPKNKTTPRVSSSIHEIAKKKEERVEVVIPLRDMSMPNGYVELRLIDINFDELYAVHNINCKYIEIGGVLFVKSIVMLNDERELDCFHLGENRLVEIKKYDPSGLSVTVTEIGGLRDIMYIKNGRSV